MRQQENRRLGVDFLDEIASLKQELLNRLRASSTLASFVSDRIYDVPHASPEELTSPYIRFGLFSSEDDGAECFESFDIVGQIDVYSWGTGEAQSTMEALKISAEVTAIIRAFEEDTQLLGGHVLSDIRFRSKRVITASDGKTKHVPITITAIVDKT